MFSAYGIYLPSFLLGYTHLTDMIGTRHACCGIKRLCIGHLFYITECFRYWQYMHVRRWSCGLGHLGGGILRTVTSVRKKCGVTSLVASALTMCLRCLSQIYAT